jgi:glutathione S-transferase
MALTIVVGDKNLSSWSMRPYVALVHTGALFEEVVLRLDRPGFAADIARHSPAGRVPVLHHDAITVWDSLAIIEYLAETFPAAGLWPKDVGARAMARSVAAEMHAGFADLRREHTMNIVARSPKVPSAAAQKDIDRIVASWQQCRARYGDGGPFLFGAFSAADAMYAPVVTRFVTYAVQVDAATRAYMDAVLAHAGVARWIQGARAEVGA